MKLKIRVTALLGVAVLLMAAAPPMRGGAAINTPRFKKVVLAPIVVEALPFENTPPHANEAEVVRKLSEEATKQAEKILIQSHIAEEVVLIKPVGATTALPTVSGTLRLPVSLPPEVRGWKASQRSGRFATVSLTITDPQTGGVLTRSEGTCNWKDALWTRGARIRRSAPLPEVLSHFARKTTERAVWKASNAFAL
jgi:hypothetical protein